MTLFDRNYVYPSDQWGGEFEERDGVIKSVRLIDDFYSIDVETQEGLITGYFPKLTGTPPEVGYMATIRIYRCGGGWYPDNRIVHWGKPEFFTAEPLATAKEEHGPPQERQT
jgi:hypothetical protein